MVGDGAALPAWAAQPLRAGVLALSLSGLPDEPAVLLDAEAGGADAPAAAQGRLWPPDPDEAAAAVPASLSVLAGRAAGVVVRLRLGDRVIRHVLPGPIPAAAGPLVLRLGWAAGSPGRWWLTLEDAGGAPLRPGAAGPGAAVWPAALAQAVCGAGPSSARQRHRHAALGACALRRAQPGPAPEALAQGVAVAAQALVPQPGGGLRPLGALRPGDRVLDDDDWPRWLAALRLFRVPAGFAFSPVRLRAGRLPLRQDMLAGPRVPLAFAGEDVLRLFGQPRVLVPAGHLPEPVQRRAWPAGAADMLLAAPVLDQPAVLRIGGLAVACPGPEGATVAAPLLGPAETAALLADGGDMRLHAGAG